MMESDGPSRKRAKDGPGSRQPTLLGFFSQQSVQRIDGREHTENIGQESASVITASSSVFRATAESSESVEEKCSDSEVATTESSETESTKK